MKTQTSGETSRIVTENEGSRKNSPTPSTGKERPILFSGPMVRAILEGRKTQTRRVLETKRLQIRRVAGIAGDYDRLCEYAKREGSVEEISSGPIDIAYLLTLCPYGVPGDRLWVRETWTHTGTGVWSVRDCTGAQDGRVLYAATDEAPCKGCWMPSIHMPRRYSRLMLELTKVRVERVQDISEEDAIAEGTQEPSLRNLGGELRQAARSERQVYSRLWNHLNLKRGYGWDASPWVWVLEFKNLDTATRVGEALTDSSNSPQKGSR